MMYFSIYLLTMQYNKYIYRFLVDMHIYMLTETILNLSMWRSRAIIKNIHPV